MAEYIIKASGEMEAFNIDKFKRSLKRIGATETIIQKLSQEIISLPELKTTLDIYKYAMRALKKEQPSLAARYNLKAALFELGPAGFPFEQFVSRIFGALEFRTSTGQRLRGKCVDHEIDIVIEKNNQHAIVECKFHNQHGPKTDVRVTLYTQARFQDVKANWIKQEKKEELHNAWLVTNTKFTTEAISYGECIGLKLLSWNYPRNESLPELIDRLGVHPITALTSLSSREKHLFMQKGFVLCKDVRKHEYLFLQLRLTKKKIGQIIEESEGICTFA